MGVLCTLVAIPGDDFRVTATWTDSDGDPINLTGYTATFAITIAGSTTTLSIGSGITVTAASGRLDMHVEDTVTALWTASGTFRLRVTSGGGEVTTLAAGSLVVEA